MRGAGGPLGLLLMVAPLIAIPVFATVGIPQFAPVAASSFGDEDVAPVSPWGPTEAEATPAPQRPADDLFAPVANSTTAVVSGKDNLNSRPNLLDDAPPPLIPPKRNLRRGGDQDEGLDGWEEVSLESPEPRNLPPAASQPGKKLPAEEVAEETGSDGFTTGLLEPEATGGGSLRGKTADGRNRPQRERPTEFGNEEFNWDIAAERLKKLGIESYHLVAITAEKRFSFTCSVTNPSNPQVTRKFIATADGPLLAVQKAIQQIDDWQTQSP